MSVIKPRGQMGQMATMTLLNCPGPPSSGSQATRFDQGPRHAVPPLICLPLRTSSWAFSVNPKGIASSSPGLRGTSYPGKDRRTPSTLKGLKHVRTEGCNPVGVESPLPTLPRVGARRANPGLTDTIPLGLEEKRPRLVRNDKPDLGGTGSTRSVINPCGVEMSCRGLWPCGRNSIAISPRAGVRWSQGLITDGVETVPTGS